MEHQLKLKIYKGMIQYILNSTHYTLKNISDLTDSSIDCIRAMYCHDVVPVGFKSEMQLLRLYQIVLEINMNPKDRSLTG